MQDKRQTENAVGMLLQENHNLHQQAAGQPYVPPSTSNSTSEHAGSITSDHSCSRIYNQSPSNRFQRFNSFKSDNLVSPRAALQSIFPASSMGMTTVQTTALRVSHMTSNIQLSSNTTVSINKLVQRAVLLNSWVSSGQS